MTVMLGRHHLRGGIRGPILRGTAGHKLTVIALVPVGAAAFGVLGSVAGAGLVAGTAVGAEHGRIVLAVFRGLVLAAQSSECLVPKKGTGVAVTKVLRFVDWILDAF